ncbi:hypothetical protein CBM2592_A260082 [Cupriavidus taiwanensis]|nr:hypothetical protein CBM2592_A260082 [Cupriavidus taiwanensis]SOY84392.1 hypothetical protein CBM2591_A300083 [Cupriavidus taiwanensis]SOZ59020.1 hypothetical protein CBM2617_A300082 [Cupriavidus taiwanensis]SOZ80161.1 hypothetical protein CBM2618_A270083 [Cupriavidus taiwanensis]SOZ80962.1 hypothetical protein CBM2622_A240081 [Cupriavidus taiwanensis]
MGRVAREIHRPLYHKAQKQRLYRPLPKEMAHPDWRHDQVFTHDTIYFPSVSLPD